MEHLEPRVVLSSTSAPAAWFAPLIRAGLATPVGVVPYEVTTGSHVTVVGLTVPGSWVVLAESGAGSATQVALADPRGVFQFGLDVNPGDTFLNLRDYPWVAAGLSSITIAVTRLVPPPDTTPPAITLTSLAPAGPTDANPTFTGVATDAGSGVARVERQIDGGPFQAIPVDADGRFSLTTGFPGRGAYDGPHAVRFRAVDRAGNVSAVVSETFTLDTAAPRVVSAPSGVLTGTVTTLDLAFSEPVGAAAMVPSNYTLTPLIPIPVGGGASSFPSTVPVAFVSRVDAKTVELTLGAPLPFGSYNLGLKPGVSDAVGHPVAGPAVFTFVVAPSPPVVVSAPTGVLYGSVATLLVNYSSPMGPGAFQASSYALTEIIGAPAGPDQPVPITGVTKLGATTAELEFAPRLSIGTYSLVVGAGVTDTFGKPVAGPTEFRLGVTDAPPVVVAAPSGTIPGPVKTLDVVFSQPMGASAFDRGNYEVWSNTGLLTSGLSLTIPATVRQVGPTIVELTFDTPLPVDNYTFLVSNSVADAAGRPLLGMSETTFNVAPPSQSVALASPPQWLEAPAGTLDVVYNQPMGPSAFQASSYTVQTRAGFPGAGTFIPHNVPIGSVKQISPTIAELTFATPVDPGTFTLNVARGVTSVSGGALGGQGSYPFAVTAPTDPRVQLVPFAVPPGSTTLDVVYSQPMGADAFQPSAYRLLDQNPPVSLLLNGSLPADSGSPWVPIVSVIKVDPLTARLVLGKPTRVTRYSVSINQFATPYLPTGITDASGKPLVGPTSFTIFSLAP